MPHVTVPRARIREGDLQCIDVACAVARPAPIGAALSPRGARVGWGVAQHFDFEGVAALEALPDRDMEPDQEMRLATKHCDPLGEEEMRALCAVLGRPRVAGRLAYLNLGCLPFRQHY
jgi:hypothetical protein